MNPERDRKLRYLRLSGMAATLPARNQEAIHHHLAFPEFLELLVEDELATRRDRLFARRLKQAGIMEVKTLETYDWSFNPKVPRALFADLATARFVREHGGVLLIGPPGTGKSHIAIALTVAAIQAGHTALYRSAFDLVQDMAEAEATGTRKEVVTQLCKVDLLVLEDLGMKRLPPTAAEDLLEIFVRRYEKGAVILTTSPSHRGLGPGAGRHRRRRGYLGPLSAPRRGHPAAGKELPHAQPKRAAQQTVRGNLDGKDRMSYLLTTYHWPLLSRPQVAGFKVPRDTIYQLDPKVFLGTNWVLFQKL